MIVLLFIGVALFADVLAPYPYDNLSFASFSKKSVS
jgi:hypothetical protein|tara:strand:+ start:114 stop:221 length:108 start_codon:yes stop_codon:yes gene_type:complete